MLDVNTTVGRIVADDYRAAAIFERYGIDFCCGGNRPMADACRERGVDSQAVAAAVEAATAQADTGGQPFNAWELDALIGHIVATHHRYIREAVPSMLAHTRKVADVHGERHPEVRKIAAAFEGVAEELMSHMAREEQVLFPYITALVSAGRGGPVPRAPFGTVANPIRMMEREHQAAGDEMAGIRQASGGYALPEDACMTYKVTYQELAAFEADLHQHVHLENNILFPKALELERRLQQR
jgi:regulator of cell morphogenesis and NO signaling